MPQVQSIRRLRRNGESVASIARKTHVSEPTVRKYLAKEDLSAVPSVRKPRASVIDPYLPVIEQWLAEDRANWRKQRHTATRIWERLRDEHGAECFASIFLKQFLHYFSAVWAAGFQQELHHMTAQTRTGTGPPCLYIPET